MKRRNFLRPIGEKVAGGRMRGRCINMAHRIFIYKEEICPHQPVVLNHYQPITPNDAAYQMLRRMVHTPLVGLFKKKPSARLSGMVVLVPDHCQAFAAVNWYSARPLVV